MSFLNSLALITAPQCVVTVSLHAAEMYISMFAAAAPMVAVTVPVKNSSRPSEYALPLRGVRSGKQQWAEQQLPLRIPVIDFANR